MRAGPSPRLGIRLAWFVGLWVASVVALGLVAYGLRLLIR